MKECVFSRKQAEAAGEPIWAGGQMQTVVLYPGGTAFSPAIIGPGQRVIVTNPFPSRYVNVEVQVWINGKWANPMWNSDQNLLHYRGVRASQLLPDDTVIVQSGYSHVADTYGPTTGNAFNQNSLITSVPYRLIVTRPGRIS